MVEKDEPDHANLSNPLWSRIVAMLVAVALVATVFILVAFFSGGAGERKRDVPHIIFILADDLVSKDFHCFSFTIYCILN